MPEAPEDQYRHEQDGEAAFPDTDDLAELARSEETEGSRGIESLPADLGYQEVPAVALLGDEWLLAMQNDAPNSQELASQYRLAAETLVSQYAGEAYARAQIGLDIRMALVRKQAGRKEAYLDDLRDAIEYALGMGFEDVANRLQRTLEAELAAEVSEEQDSVSEQLAAACEGLLSPQDCEEILGMPHDEAVGYAFSLLIEQGIEDPEALLKEKGFLE